MATTSERTFRTNMLADVVDCARASRPLHCFAAELCPQLSGNRLACRPAGSSMVTPARANTKVCDVNRVRYLGALSLQFAHGNAAPCFCTFSTAVRDLKVPSALAELVSASRKRGVRQCHRAVCSPSCV